MNTIKTMALGALALASAGSASAQTVIRIVASNGDRTATQTAIANLLASGWTFHGVNGPTSSTGALGTATGANFGAWSGTFQGSPVIIKVSYAGALAGISAIAGNTDQRFVVSNGSGTGNLPNPLTGSELGVDYEIGKADFGFSTNFQSTSPFNGVYEGVTYSPVIEEVVGVSPLGFYASPGFPEAGANITTQLAQLLYTTGSVRLSQFTGNYTTDNNKTVWAIGRNTDAGQRFGAYTEIGLGTATSVRVWQPSFAPANGGTAQTTSGGFTYGGVVGNHQLWPAETVSGIPSGLGSGGYSSGALLASALTVDLGPGAYKGSFYNPDTEENEDLYPDAVDLSLIHI